MNDDKKGLAKVQLKRQAVAIREPFSSTEEELRALSRASGSQVLELARVRIPLELLELLPRETAELHSLIPVRLSGDALLVAMAQPSNKRVIDELSFVTGKSIVPYVSPAEDLEAVIASAYLASRRGERFYDGPRYVDSGSDVAEEEPVDEFAPIKADPPIEVSQSAAPTGTEELGAGAPAPGEPPQSPALSVLEIPDLEVGVEALKSRASVQGLGTEPMDFDDADEHATSGLSLSFEGQEDVQGVAGEIHVARNDAPAMAVNSGPATNSGAGSPHVLVVEDDADIQRLVKRLLEEDGFQVSLAADGEAALSALKSAAPDLIVLDAMLPKVHGFEIVRRVRASRRFGKLPIVILTAVHRGWRYAEDLRELSGVQHYLEKPFDGRQLVAAVRSSLGTAEDSLPISQMAAQHLRQGIDAYREGDLELAQSHLERGIRADPSAYQVHYQLALLHRKRGRAFEAIGSLEQAVRLRPRYFVGIKNLALLYQKAGFKNKSAEMWQRALGVAPDENTKESIRQHLSRFN